MKFFYNSEFVRIFFTLFIFLIVLLVMLFISDTLWYCDHLTPTGARIKHDTSINKIVIEHPNFLSHEECDQIIAIAEPKLFQSKVYSDKEDLIQTNTRVSMQSWLKDSDHKIVASISERIASILGLPEEYAEDLQVVRYTDGGFFNAHYDACEGTKEYCNRMEGKSGPRFATFIIYLSDDFEGGETNFPKLGFSVKPQKGKGVLFYNTTSDGQIIVESMHGGLPVRNGTKWICNKWFHLKPA